MSYKGLSPFDIDTFLDNTETPTQETPQIKSEDYKGLSTFNLEEFIPSIKDADQITAEDIQKMSLDERMQLIEDLEQKREVGSAKSFLSNLTFGFSERIPDFKPKEDEPSGVGSIIGSVLPIGGIAKLGFMGLKQIPQTAKWLHKIAAPIVSGTAMATHSGISQIGREEELNMQDVTKDFLIGAGLHILGSGANKLNQWFKSLSPKQASEFLVSGQLPPDLPPTAYKFYQNEVVPEIQAIAKTEYETLAKQTESEAINNYQKEIANTRAKHELELNELAKQNKLSDETYKESLSKYESKVKQLEFEHQSNLQKIEEANQTAKEEFIEQSNQWQQQQARDEIVSNALKQQAEESTPLIGRVKKGGEDIGFKPSTPKTPSLKNDIGNIISNSEITDSYKAGQSMTTVIRELDALEYQKVNDLYDIAKEANANISLTRNTLARELQGIETELSKIPHPSAVEQQKLNAVRNIIKKITLQDAEGNIIGLVPIENQVLLDQAKSLRYVLDFDFAHGTPKGIFKPVINALENAVERGATQAGNRKAYTAHNKARKAYKNWTQDYNNDYINKFRDTSNVDYSKNFKTSLDLDSYHPIEKIISRAYPGQQLANATRRELVNKHLGKYIDNPNLAVGEEYQRTINELSNIIGDPVTKEIEQSLAQARRSKIKGQKLEKLEQPKPPKELEIPEKPKKPEAKVLTKPVEIPKFKEPKPTKEMQALSKKLKITPEKIQAKTETPSGLRELKNDLNKTEIGKGQYQRIADSKMKSILQNKKVVGEYTGNELYEVLNQEKNYDLVVELIGESETKDLLKAAKSIAEDKIKGEKIKQLISKETLKSLLLLHLL